MHTFRDDNDSDKVRLAQPGEGAFIDRRPFPILSVAFWALESQAFDEG